MREGLIKCLDLLEKRFSHPMLTFRSLIQKLTISITSENGTIHLNCSLARNDQIDRTAQNSGLHCIRCLAESSRISAFVFDAHR